MCDYAFQMLIVGDVGVGKSSLLWRFMDDLFIYEYYPTVRTQFKYCQEEVGGRQVLLQVWDAPGKERFRGVLEMAYRLSDAVVIVYDCTSAESFRNVDNWMRDVGVFCSKEVNKLLVGTKCEAIEGREVTEEEASHYAEQQGLSYIEASAKDDIKVKSVFRSLALKISKRLFLEHPAAPSTRDTGAAPQKGQENVEEGQADGKDDLLPPSKRSKQEDGDHQGGQIEEDKDKDLGDEEDDEEDDAPA